MKFEPGEEGGTQRAEARAGAALGLQQLQAWMQHGRMLDDDGCEALAAGAGP